MQSHIRGFKSKQITSQSDVGEIFLAKFGNVYLIIATIVYYAACGYTVFRARVPDARPHDPQLAITVLVSEGP